MDEGAAAWSGLGSNMNLPSTIRDEMERLRLELRDLKLEVARDLMELKQTVSSVIGDMVSIVDRQKSLLTRVEGLESRAQGAGPIHASTPSDPFNAFAYVTLDELQGQDEEPLDYSIEEVPSEFEEVAPEPIEPSGPTVAEVNLTIKDDEEDRLLSDEDMAAKFLGLVYSHIDEVGGVLNNVLFTKLWREEVLASPGIKALVKAGLKADEDIELYKLSKLRGLYHRTGGDALEIYERLYG